MPSRGNGAVEAPRRFDPTIGLAVAVLVTGAGLAIGARPLRDNSFLTHLATGRLILDSGSVPDADPYTFTAAGEPWVVQSWLMSVLYATAEAIGGLDGLRLVMGALTGAVALLGWRLMGSCQSLIARLALTAVFLGVGAQVWAERPFMVGLLSLGAVATLAIQGGDPRWLVPLGWIWVNSHGSFPLGILYLVVLAVGCRLDGRSARGPLRCLPWLSLGCALGAVGPLGVRVLLFPAELLSQQDVLSGVTEWRAPTFENLGQRLFLLQLLLAIILLVRRPSYRDGLVVVVFGGAALVGLRNVSVASLLLLPGMADAVGSIGSLRVTSRPRLGRGILAAALAAAVLLPFARMQDRDLDLRPYPVASLAYLGATNVDRSTTRLAATDFVGNVLELVYGSSAHVFYDDRFDMFPEDVTRSYRDIARVSPRLRTALSEADIDLLLWQRTAPVVQTLARDPDWRVLFAEEGWVLLCRRGAPLGPDSPAC